MERLALAPDPMFRNHKFDAFVSQRVGSVMKARALYTISEKVFSVYIWNALFTVAVW